VCGPRLWLQRFRSSNGGRNLSWYFFTEQVENHLYQSLKTVIHFAFYCNHLLVDRGIRNNTNRNKIIENRVPSHPNNKFFGINIVLTPITVPVDKSNVKSIPTEILQINLQEYSGRDRSTQSTAGLWASLFRLTPASSTCHGRATTHTWLERTL